MYQKKVYLEKVNRYDGFQTIKEGLKGYKTFTFSEWAKNRDPHSFSPKQSVKWCLARPLTNKKRDGIKTLTSSKEKVENKCQSSVPDLEIEADLGQ